MESSDFAVEVKILREEMNKMKRDFQELVMKKTDANSSVLSPMQSELAYWTEAVEKQVSEFSGTLRSVKDVCVVDLEQWKRKMEQKLMDIVSTMRHSNTSSQSARDFFSNHDLVGTHGGSELIDLQQTDYNRVPGLDCVKIEPDLNYLDPDPLSAPVSNPDHFSYDNHTNHNDLETVREEMSKLKRNIQDLLSRKDDGGHANATSYSSVTDNSTLDVENSILMLKEFYAHVVKIKANIERRVKHLSVTLHESDVYFNAV